ncbi:MAG: hypothetical protein ACOZQL_00400 [Myxococcota bacterium]
MTPEVRVIDEGTAELQLPAACPTCEGALEIRISVDGARSFCGVCHAIGRPHLTRDPHQGLQLQFRTVARA